MGIIVVNGQQIDSLTQVYHRVTTNSGNHGKPGKSRKKVPGMEKSWNSKKPE